MLKCAAFIVFHCGIEGGLICLQPDSVCTISETAEELIDAVGRIGARCVNSFGTMIQANDDQISQLYDQVTATCNATNLIENINSIEIYSSMIILQSAMNCALEREQLINEASKKIDTLAKE